MSREILFKGKRIDNGEWVEGYLFGDGIIGSNRMFIGELTIEDYKGNADDGPTIITGSYYSEVDPETVCQYTGLTDKNGRKIFEGDCLGRKENVIEYLCGTFCVSGDRSLSMMAKYNEVIGNIFDKE